VVRSGHDLGPASGGAHETGRLHDGQASHAIAGSCFGGLRVPVSTVVGMIAEGMTAEEVLDAYPGLELADVREALRYAAEAVRERELPLAG
jgi:uncharacterized protein (DUF433 family)